MFMNDVRTLYTPHSAQNAQSAYGMRAQCVRLRHGSVYMHRLRVKTAHLDRRESGSGGKEVAERSGKEVASGGG